MKKIIFSPPNPTIIHDILCISPYKRFIIQLLPGIFDIYYPNPKNENHLAYYFL